MATLERFCRACNAKITDKNDVYTGWCKSCQRFDYEIYNSHKPDEPAPPITFDVIIADIQRVHKFRPSLESLVEFAFEPINRGGLMYFRALVKVNGRVAEYSRRDQATPQDALRELWHLCCGTQPEDI